MEAQQLSFGVHDRCPSQSTLVPKDYYYLICNHRILFVVGLLWSRFLTTNTIVSALPWYLTFNGDVGVMNSAIFINVLGSLSSIFEILMAHSAVSFIGRFGTLLLSTVAYIVALVLFWMFHPHNVNWVLVVIIILSSLGISGGKVLQDVLLDIVHDIDTSHGRDETRSIARAKIWSCGAYVSSALIAVLWVAPDAIGGVHPSWETSFLICMITMSLALIIFGVGNINNLLKCISRCLTRRDKSSKMDSDIEKGEDKGMKHETPIDTEGKEDKRNISSYKQDVMLVSKSLLRMLPIWVVFLVLSLMSSSGSSLFLQQYSNLNTDSNIAVQMYNLVQEFSKFAITYLYSWIWGLPKNRKVKIGLGMLCGILSCISAWQLEVHRLKEVRVYGEDARTSISFLWLVPQFCLLGCMEGLTEERLLEFYKSQMKEQYLQRYREEYIALVMGIGKVLNIFLVLILKGWFGDTINHSRLDKYYMVLMWAGLANFIFYCCVARFFYKEQLLANDDQNLVINDSQQEVIGQIGEILQNGDLANDDREQDNLNLANDDSEQDNPDLANDDHKKDNPNLANDDQDQDNLSLTNGDSEQDNLDLTNDDREQDNLNVGNDDSEQDNLNLTNDDQKQDNLNLANDDQEQDNLNLTNEDLQQDHLIEQIRDIEQNQDFAEDDQKHNKQAVVDLKSG